MAPLNLSSSGGRGVVLQAPHSSLPPPHFPASTALHCLCPGLLPRRQAHQCSANSASAATMSAARGRSNPGPVAPLRGYPRQRGPRRSPRALPSATPSLPSAPLTRSIFGTSCLGAAALSPRALARAAGRSSALRGSNSAGKLFGPETNSRFNGDRRLHACHGCIGCIG